MFPQINPIICIAMGSKIYQSRTVGQETNTSFFYIEVIEVGMLVASTARLFVHKIVGTLW